MSFCSFFGGEVFKDHFQPGERGRGRWGWGGVPVGSGGGIPPPTPWGGQGVSSAGAAVPGGGGCTPQGHPPPVGTGLGVPCLGSLSPWGQGWWV